MGVLDTGLCNYVLVSYADNALSARRPDKYNGHILDDNAPVFGQFGAVSRYAMAARRAMHEFNTGPDTWSDIAVDQRKWANLNPEAQMYDRPLTEKEYFDGDWLVEPFRLYDCCLISDGGRAEPPPVRRSYSVSSAAAFWAGIAVSQNRRPTTSIITDKSAAR